VSVLAAVRGRCRFPDRGPVTCAVSGGPDSVALLVLAADAGLEPTAVHVDHGLRPGSADEAEVVAAAAHRLGAGFRALAAPVPPGPDLESRARAARHDALGPGCLYGHTADDQAETVLLALLRGAGLDGLAAMAPDRHPLLGVRRYETHALCAELGLDVVHDPSNADPRFRRNRVRHEVLPLLDDVAERDVVPLLCRLAEHARADVALLDQLAGGIDPTSAPALAAAPGPLAARALRRWLRPHLGGHPPDAGTVERVLAVARGEATGTQLAGGTPVRRTRQRLRVDDGPHGGCAEVPG